MEDITTSVVKVTDASLKAKLGVLGLPPSFRIFIPDAQVFSHNLEELLNEKGAGSLREAFVTDGNMARNWKDIFSDWREEKEGAVHERSVCKSAQSYHNNEQRFISIRERNSLHRAIYRIPYVETMFNRQ